MNEKNDSADAKDSDDDVLVAESEGGRTNGKDSGVAQNKKKDSVLDQNKKNTKLIGSFKELMGCESIDDLLDKVLGTSSAIESLGDNVERGTTTRERAAKSLLGRWMEKSALPNKGGSDTAGNGNVNDFVIERDTVVSCDITTGRGQATTTISKDYRVLGVYDKFYNKWFMTSEKKHWGVLMKEDRKKLFKMAIRMMETGSIEDYDDVALDDEDYKLKDICRVIDGNDIVEVKGTYAPSGL